MQKIDIGNNLTKPKQIISYFIRGISIFLAIVFLAAGLGKIFHFIDFSTTISNIVFMPSTLANGLATIIICIEIAGALALLIHYRTEIVSILFCLLIAIFIWVLSIAIIRGKEIDCNCFGIIGINLSNSKELILDVLLFNSFALLSYLANIFNTSNKTDRTNKWTLRIVGPIILILLEYWLISPILSKSLSIEKLDSNTLIEYAKYINPQFALFTKSNRLVLLMDYTDLSCPICFDDYSAFSDSLVKKLKPEKNSIMMTFFKLDGFCSLDSSSHLKRWAKANNINYPIYFLSDTIYNKIHFVKSIVLVLDRNDRVLFLHTFPLGEEYRRYAIDLLISE